MNAFDFVYSYKFDIIETHKTGIATPLSSPKETVRKHFLSPYLKVKLQVKTIRTAIIVISGQSVNTFKRLKRYPFLCIKFNIEATGQIFILSKHKSNKFDMI